MNNINENISETAKPFNLTKQDLQSLSESFITPDMAMAAKFRRVDDATGAELLGRQRKVGDDCSGIIIPYDSQVRRSGQSRLRRDNPTLVEKPDGTIKAEAKYLSAFGAKPEIYFTPGTTAEMLANANLQVVITEGEKKTLALERLASEDYQKTKWHFIPIGLSGVWNFNSSGTEKLPDGSERTVKQFLPDFDKITLNDRKIIILFDANVRTNRQVSAARAALYVELQARVAKVLYAEMPEMDGVNGIDDLLGLVERESGIEAAIEKGLAIIHAAHKPKKSSTTAANFELIKSGEDAGVYYSDEKDGRFWVCSPLEIVAETQTEIGENYGRLLRWSDSKSRVKTWAMPLGLVHGDGIDLVKYLVSRGLMVGASRNHHDKLKNYINLSEPQETVICTDKIGWHGDVFIFPDKTIGTYENEIVYQPEYPVPHKFGIRGTLEEWQEHISKYCIGNSRLAFGVALAFAPVFLTIVDMQSGGFHFRDSTSSGKTTAAKVSGSVWGGSNDELGYCQSWKATANGLESVAEMHNHSLLCLDELAQIDGRQAGDVAYMLANGEGKKRMTKSITPRRSLSWQLLFLSTGEISLADKMNEAGLTIKGGQEIRILDIPSDTGKFGVFDKLHEFPSGQSFADYLRSASREYYGTPIREFLGQLIGIKTTKLKANWDEFHAIFVAKILPDTENHPSEIYRAATRFALVAFAGEMATNLNITKWQQSEAVRAAETVFRAWFDNRSGRGGSDAERAISQIRAFIEAHGSSRFEMLTANNESLDQGKIINRAGFRKRNDEGELEYLFLPEIFRQEVCKGFDYKFVCKALNERGFLRTGSAGFQKQLKYVGTQIRPYWISPKILSGWDEPSEAEKAKVADVGK